MISPVGSTFFETFLDLKHKAHRGPFVENDNWQGFDVRGKPDMKMRELRNVVFEIDLQGIEELAYWQIDIQPDLPWADDHFLERVGRKPLNPGVEWQNWPYGGATQHLLEDGTFNHTYQERLWPRKARLDPRTRVDHWGILYRYHDLDDLVDLLIQDPWTRQAWIPLFFPEDTGGEDEDRKGVLHMRKPCTLGYQFLRRVDSLHLFYPLRSCDLFRHFRNDCYLAVRLLLWVLEECRKKDSSKWNQVRPGTYSMWITSLHLFEGDRIRLSK